MEFLTSLNDLKSKNSKIEGPLSKRVATQIVLTEEVKENMDNNDWVTCRENFERQIDNQNNLFNIMEQQQKLVHDILAYLEVVSKRIENVVALSVYRDFISLFVFEVKKKLGREVWLEVMGAIGRKRKFKKTNFKKEEMRFISQLEDFLHHFNMTVEDFELLMGLKAVSNSEFHKDEEQNAKVARQQLETSFPDDLNDFKDPLRKLFNAFDTLGWS